MGVGNVLFGSHNDDPKPKDTDTIQYGHVAFTGYPVVHHKAPTVPDTGMSGLKNIPYTPSPTNTVPEDFSQVSFLYAVQLFDGVADDVAPGIADGWTALGDAVRGALQEFKTGVEQLHASDAWSGATSAATQANINASLPALDALTSAAYVNSTLVKHFSATMATTAQALTSNYAGYIDGMKDYPHYHAVIEQQYDQFAQEVLGTPYSNGIADIAKNHPPVYTGTLPQVTPGNPQPPGGPVDTSGGGKFTGALPGGPAGLPNALTVPKITAADLATPNLTDAAQALSAPQTSANPIDTALPAAEQGLSGLGSSLQSALGQAAGNAQQAANIGAPGGFGGLGKLPLEGALGLGPKSANGSAGAASRVGAGGGVGSPRLPMGKPAAAAVAGGTAADRTVAAGYRSGLSGSSGAAGGAPAAGAPGGGHQGAATGGPHQPSKALRRKKNGEELIGDAQAVVAVLGESSQTQKPANPT